MSIRAIRYFKFAKKSNGCIKVGYGNPPKQVVFPDKNHKCGDCEICKNIKKRIGKEMRFRKQGFCKKWLKNVKKGINFIFEMIN